MSPVPPEPDPPSTAHEGPPDAAAGVPEPGRPPPATVAPVVGARRSFLVDLSPLRQSPAFARLWVGTTVAGVGSMVTATAVSLHLYELTHSTFLVSLVAWFSLGPMILTGLYGGALADRLDRRSLALWSASVGWLSTVVLAAIAWWQVETLWPFYLITTVNAVAATMAMAARQAITPRLLPARLLPQAAALQGIAMGVTVTTGPAIAGLLVARVGYQWTYTLDALLFLAGFVGVFTLPPIRPQGRSEARGGSAVREGLRYLAAAPNVRMSFVLDLIAMIFANPVVLFPAVAAVLLGGGPVTAGILLSSFAAGGIVAGLFSGRLTGYRWHGQAVRWAVSGYGLAITGFGVVLWIAAVHGTAGTSTNFRDADLTLLAWAAAFLVLAGGADGVSAIFRMAILQAAVEDRFRGRIQGVFTVVVAGGPRLGQMLAGGAAAITPLWLPPALGGLVVFAGVIVAVSRARSFLRYDGHHPGP